MFLPQSLHNNTVHSAGDIDGAAAELADADVDDDMHETVGDIDVVDVDGAVVADEHADVDEKDDGNDDDAVVYEDFVGSDSYLQIRVHH